MVLPSGTATLQLRTNGVYSPEGAVVQHRECAGLEGRKIASIALQQSKAGGGHQRYFGASDSGELLTFGAQLFVQCKVSNSVKSNLCCMHVKCQTMKTASHRHLHPCLHCTLLLRPRSLSDTLAFK